ncbi:MAG: hypothetical protein ABIS50_14370 [Luteolibacter sp.]|uniref:hypothetical protein n=1 Tax=Luteolibacter sp. TaxID=1962973 RepID=UPI003264E66A
MKTNFFIKGMGCAVSAMLAGEVLAGPPVLQEAMTQDQLILARRKADGMDPMKKMPEVKGEDPSVVNRPQSLLASSDIISYGRFATLVPKRAILQIPKSVADRIKQEPGAILQSWSEFYAANRGWITTVEVSRTQAEGNNPIAEETQRLYSKSGNLVVATYLGGPISVLPLKVPVVTAPEKTKP